MMLPHKRDMPGILPSPPRDRVLLGIFGLGWLIAAGAFLAVAERESQPFAVLSPLVFALAGIATIAFALAPWSQRLLVVSGALSFLAVLSRSAAVALNLLFEQGPAGLDPAYAVLGLVIYPLFALALLYAWDQGFGELWRYHHSIRGSDRRKAPGARSSPRC